MSETTIRRCPWCGCDTSRGRHGVWELNPTTDARYELSMTVCVIPDMLVDRPRKLGVIRAD